MSPAPPYVQHHSAAARQRPRTVGAAVSSKQHRVAAVRSGSRTGAADASANPAGAAGLGAAAAANGGARTRAAVIGHYILGKTIGEGTFGKVKIGTHILTGEKVAVKILEKSRIVEVADVQRVAREIKILKRNRHRNIIQLFEVLDTPSTIYLIMENADGWVRVPRACTQPAPPIGRRRHHTREGRPLVIDAHTTARFHFNLTDVRSRNLVELVWNSGEMFDYIVSHQRVQEDQACYFFHQILDGAEYLHRMEVTHRDLKPENLLLQVGHMSDRVFVRSERTRGLFRVFFRSSFTHRPLALRDGGWRDRAIVVDDRRGGHELASSHTVSVPVSVFDSFVIHHLVSRRSRRRPTGGSSRSSTLGCRTRTTAGASSRRRAARRATPRPR